VENSYDPLRGDQPAFRFPEAPHLFVPSKVEIYEGAIMPEEDAEDWLKSTTWHIEEWVDGVELGVTLDDTGRARLQNRSQVLSYKKLGKTRKLMGLWDWLEENRAELEKNLWPNLGLFGTWCRIANTVQYDCLLDYMVFHSLVDRDRNVVLCPERRDDFLQSLPFEHVRASNWATFDLKKEAEEAASFYSEFASDETPAKGIYLIESDDDAQIYRFRLLNPDADHRAFKQNPLVENSLIELVSPKGF
jgi:hypothetical protein